MVCFGSSERDAPFRTNFEGGQNREGEAGRRSRPQQAARDSHQEAEIKGRSKHNSYKKGRAMEASCALTDARRKEARASNILREMSISDLENLLKERKATANTQRRLLSALDHGITGVAESVMELNLCIQALVDTGCRFPKLEVDLSHLRSVWKSYNEVMSFMPVAKPSVAAPPRRKWDETVVEQVVEDICNLLRQKGEIQGSVYNNLLSALPVVTEYGRILIRRRVRARLPEVVYVKGGSEDTVRVKLL